MAAEYPGAIYRGGHESVLLFGVEAGMLAPDAQSIGAVPQMQLAGMTSPPQISFNDSPAPVYGGGAGDPLFMTEGRKELTASGNLMVGAGAGTKKFLQAALRGADAPVASYPNASRKGCQPVIALGYGAYDACASGDGFLSYLRYAMMNSLSITIAENGPVTAAWSAMALLGGDGAALAAGDVAPAALQIAGGAPFSMQHLQLIITPPVGTPYDYQGVINSVTFAATNNVAARSIRSLANAGGDTTNPLFRSARQLVPSTRPPLTVTLDLADRLPYLSGSSIEAILNNGTSSLTIATQIAYGQTSSQNGGDPQSPMGFGQTFLCSGLTIQ